MSSSKKHTPIQWPADQYAIGAFIQHTLSNRALSEYHFHFHSDDNLLDVGCGDGSYTIEIAKKIPAGKITGRDPSEKMIAHAAKQKKPSNVVFECEDLMALNEKEKYSVITAFWCLQWVPDFNVVLKNIFNALKSNGRFFAIMPSENCLHYRLLNIIKNSGQFPVLDHFNSHLHFQSIAHCEKQARQLGFTAFSAHLTHPKLPLPDMTTLEKFINGIPLFNGQVRDTEIPRLNAALVEAYKKISKEEFHELCWKDEIIILTGVK